MSKFSALLFEALSRRGGRGCSAGGASDGHGGSIWRPAGAAGAAHAARLRQLAALGHPLRELGERVGGEELRAPDRFRVRRRRARCRS